MARRKAPLRQHTESTPRICISTITATPEGSLTLDPSHEIEWRTRGDEVHFRLNRRQWETATIATRHNGPHWRCPTCWRWPATLYWAGREAQCAACAGLRAAWTTVTKSGSVATYRGALRRGQYHAIMELCAEGDVLARVALEDEGLLPRVVRPLHGTTRHQRAARAQHRDARPGATTEAAVVGGTWSSDPIAEWEGKEKPRRG